MVKRTQNLSPDMDTSDDSNEYKREMRNQRMKDIGLAGVAGALSGAKLGALALDYKGRRQAEKREADKNQKSGMELEIENAKKDRLNKREAEGAAKEVKRNMSTFGFKNGGSASSRADGIAQRGKTRGKIV
jgi:hypothetical protein